MKKKNKKTTITSILFILAVAGLGYLLINRANNDLSSKEELPLNSDQLLAVYIEGDNGYELSSSRTFPTDGYRLNTKKSSCKNGGTITQDSKTKTLNVSAANADQCTVYFDIAQLKTVSYGLKANPESVTEYADGTTTEMYASGSNYIYIGSNPNNYLKFGSDSELWRIIGIFGGNLKIMRATTIGELAWDTSGNTLWDNSSLKTLLNGDYYYARGDYAYSSTSTKNGIDALMRSEMGSVALINSSDYVNTFANGVDQKCFNDIANCSQGNPTASWMYNEYSNGLWVMTTSDSETYSAAAIQANGNLQSGLDATQTMEIAPVTSLKPDAYFTIKEGAETPSDPYKIYDPYPEISA